MNSKLYGGFLVFILCCGNAIYSMEGPEKPVAKRKKEEGRPSSEEAKKQCKTDFFNAVIDGNITKVRALIEKDATLINVADNAGIQPIHHAAKGCHNELVEYLLECGADSNATTSNGWTPIHYAVLYGHREMVECLVGRGADINASDNEGSYPIHYAVMAGQISMVEYLVAQGANIGATDGHGSQPIHAAAGYGTREVVDYLVGRGANLNAANDNGVQPIHLAARGANREVVYFLIHNGAVFDVKLDWDELLSALSTWTESDSLPTMNLYGVDFEVINLPQLFRMAAGQNALATVQAILDDHRDKLSEDDLIQALVGAATAGHVRIVDFIYAYMNRDVNLRQHIPQAFSTALALAATQGQLDVIYTIMRRDGIIRHSEDYPELPTDFSLLGRAETLLRQLLERYSASEITEDERLSNYNRTLQTFANRRTWRRLFTPAAGEPTTYFSFLLPPETGERILNILTYNYLCDVVLPGEDACSRLTISEILLLVRQAASQHERSESLPSSLGETDSSTDLEVPTDLLGTMDEGTAIHHTRLVPASFTYPRFESRCTQATIVALCALIISAAYHFSW